MSAEQILVFALLVAAFVAGWLARDPPRRHEASPTPEPPAPEPSDAPAEEPAPAPPPAAAPPADLYEDALDAYDRALDDWLERREGTASLAALEAKVAALGEVAASGPLADGRAALEEAARLLAPARTGRPLDVATSKALEPLEDRMERAWRAIAQATR